MQSELRVKLAICEHFAAVGVRPSKRPRNGMKLGGRLGVGRAAGVIDT